MQFHGEDAAQMMSTHFAPIVLLAYKVRHCLTHWPFTARPGPFTAFTAFP